MKAMLPETKRRRLLLKQERMTDKGALEATEGSTYQSGIPSYNQVFIIVYLHINI